MSAPSSIEVKTTFTPESVHSSSPPSSLNALLHALHRCLHTSSKDSKDSKQCAPLTLTGHTNIIYALTVLLPTGLIASASADRSIKIWDVHTGKCARTLTGHTGWVYGLIVLRNGHVVSASPDGTLKEWDVSTGKCVRTVKEPTVRALSPLALLPNGCIASANDDNTIRIWNMLTGKCVNTLKGHTYNVFALTVLPNGCLVSGAADDTVRIWNVSTGKCTHILEGHTDFVLSLAVLPNGLFASGCADGSINVWHVSTTKWLFTLHGHSGGTAKWSSRLRRFRQNHRIWRVNPRNLNPGFCVQIIKTGHTRMVRALVVLPDGRLASGGGDRTICIWDMPVQRATQLVRDIKQYVTTHINADPLASAVQAKLPSVAKYLRNHGFEKKVIAKPQVRRKLVIKSKVGVQPIKPGASTANGLVQPVIERKSTVEPVVTRKDRVVKPVIQRKGRIKPVVPRTGAAATITLQVPMSDAEKPISN